ncbi:hypothetical protein PLICRDRAFT_150145 [Plicaturopsis crispa FD-325 SS-3]|nr:hypothetical protein PLICRDRAFT_150145 [Plicaturopsis crispa FD-325 SS-3]
MEADEQPQRVASPAPTSVPDAEASTAETRCTFEEQIKPLREAISQKPPFCSGTCALAPEDFTLFYGKDDGVLGRVNLSHATAEQLDALAAVCDPATFGRGQEDVLDETYRKAGKLDVPNFGMPFELDRTGIVDVVRSALLEGHDDAKSIHAELYKLNVYGKGAFFKAHKDTPRGEDMLGSLVLVFPTPHEGGVLFIRQGGKEWAFDAASEIAKADAPSLGYVAFYSDVEHEVGLVESGHRVTLTYNLYFADKSASLHLLPKNVAPAVSPAERAFTSVLSGLLADENFLCNGGRLAFGLRHQYPVTVKTSLVDMVKRLKGADAEISRACAQLGLHVSVKVVYAEGSYMENPGLVMLDSVLDTEYSGQIDCDITEMLVEDYQGERIAKPGGATDLEQDEEDEGSRPVRWVTNLTKFSTVKSDYVAYGNEAQLDCVYGDICLIVEVGGFGDRATVSSS